MTATPLRTKRRLDTVMRQSWAVVADWPTRYRSRRRDKRAARSTASKVATGFLGLLLFRWAYVLYRLTLPLAHWAVIAAVECYLVAWATLVTAAWLVLLPVEAARQRQTSRAGLR